MRMIKLLKHPSASGVPKVSRISIVLCLVFFLGCFPGTDPNAVGRRADTDVEDGGVVENADRDKAETYFAALGKVQSVEEEEKLLTEFGQWLKEKGYRIRVEVKNGKHVLSCPYFPPVTPWTDHTFLDVKNLELLPQ